MSQVQRNPGNNSEKPLNTFRGLEVFGTAGVCVLAPDVHGVYSRLALAGCTCWCVQTGPAHPTDGTSLRLEV